jgi:hypothetical protein
VSGGVVMGLPCHTNHTCNRLDILLLGGRYSLDSFSIPRDIVASVHPICPIWRHDQNKMNLLSLNEEDKRTWAKGSLASISWGGHRVKVRLQKKKRFNWDVYLSHFLFCI